MRYLILPSTQWMIVFHGPPLSLIDAFGDTKAYLISIEVVSSGRNHFFGTKVGAGVLAVPECAGTEPPPVPQCPTMNCQLPPGPNHTCCATVALSLLR